MLTYTTVFLLTLLLGISVFALLWYCKKYILIFLQFRNVSVLPYVLKYNLIRAKNVIPTSYFFQSTVEICKKYQSEGFVVCWVPRPFLLIFDEEATKVFSSEHSLIDKVIEFEMMKEVFGYGILTSNGERWRSLKKLLNPIFHITMVKDKVAIVSKNALVLVEKLQEVVDEPSIDMLKFLRFCSFINISEFLVGNDVNDSEKCAELEMIMSSISKGTQMVVHRVLHPWLSPKFTLWLTSDGRKHIKMIREAHESIKKILREKIEFVKSSKAKQTGEQRKQSPPSFTQILIEHHLKDPSFTFEDMCNEFKTFVSAGFDAVSYGMMWCLFILGHHPEVQDLIYDEVEDVLKSNMTYEELSNFKYMDRVIKEALRIYPPIPLYARDLIKPVFWGKNSVPAGTSVLFFPYMAHRNPDLFPDPEKFDPDRFLDGVADKKPTTYSFAEGMRNCLGKRFAEIEMKISLAHIIKNFKIISLDRREDIQLQWNAFLAPVEPLRMRLTPRLPNST